MIKLVAIDVDGTLLDSNQTISEANRECIKALKNAGIRIIICTGRPFIGVKNILKELELMTEDDYVISFNGALIQTSLTQQVLFERRLSYNNFLEIKKLSDFLQLPYHIQSPQGIYTTQQLIGKYTLFDSQLNGSPIYQIENYELKEVPIFKVIFCDEPAKLNRQITYIPTYYREKYTSGKSLDIFFEFLHKEADKGQALQNLCDHLNIHHSEVMAIGDNDNDIAMFRYAEISVAMGNASPAAKEAADFITNSNDEDGVAKSLLKLIETKDFSHSSKTYQSTI